MKKIIHINQHVIRKNKKEGLNDPVITVKTYKENRYAHSVRILGESKVVYSPDKPLSCGAYVWLETEAEVELDMTDEAFIAHAKRNKNNPEFRENKENVLRLARLWKEFL
jgi:hypothetical protein